jgi:DNA-binding NtrC family response regulator
MGALGRMLPCAAPVLIEGETGTGKELVARALHYLGPRAGGPFVPVNCGALPDHLLENELFGHERGAYTDARTASTGAIGAAAGGTLFLDEIEALSPKAQAALLRFLQDREYRPLGSSRALRSDARVVAASNADLRALSAGPAFRADLFFRLDVLSLRLPPLRERRGDIGLLAEHFVKRFCDEYGKARKALAPGALAMLEGHDWPGNVRELENLIHRSVLLADGPALFPQPAAADAKPQDTSQGSTLPGEPFAVAKARAIEAFERSYLTALLRATGGNVSEAARRADKERRALGKLLKKHAIRAP